jgi:hypothetical protein
MIDKIPKANSAGEDLQIVSFILKILLILSNLLLPMRVVIAYFNVVIQISGEFASSTRTLYFKPA